MTWARRRHAWTILGGVLIAFGLLATFLVRRADSGVVITVSPPPGCSAPCSKLLRRVRVTARRAGGREAVATHRASMEGRIEFRLDPGPYRLEPLPVGRRFIGRPVRVRVARGHTTKATVRYERRRR